MDRKEFAETAIESLVPPVFEKSKHTLINSRYIPLLFLKEEDISPLVMKEIISDYFEKVELHTDKVFQQIIDKYSVDIDSVVESRIEKGTQPKKGGGVPRARKYYYKAYSLRKAGLESFEDLIDYSRIMLCLYMGIINNKFNSISDFDYTSESLNGSKIISALRNEEISLIMGKKKRFNTKGVYNSDHSSFVMLAIMYYCIKSREVEVED